MRLFFNCYTVASLVALLALPPLLRADETENYDKDAEYAESTPPMIPHRIKDTSDGEYCLRCHGAGVNGAPMSPHPVRLSCTGCHAQGEIKGEKPLKRGKNKK